MAPPDVVTRWLRRIHHDLVKRLLWSARDCRELGRDPLPGELITTLLDEEGEPIEALALWQHFAVQAPEGIELCAFETALRQSIAAAASNDLQGVLALEPAYERLKSQVAAQTRPRERP